MTKKNQDTCFLQIPDKWDNIKKTARGLFAEKSYDNTLVSSIQDKREDILNAALPLFANRGYYGTPVSLIAEKANVGAGTIYRYFKDKDELVNTLYQTWKKQLSEYILEGLDLDLSVRSMFREVVLRMANFALEHRDAFFFLEAHHHTTYLNAESLAVKENVESLLFASLRLWRDQEIIVDAPAEALFSMAFGTFVELIKRHWNGEFVIDAAILEKVEEMCWQAIRR